MTLNAIFTLLLPVLLLQQVTTSELDGLQQRKQLLENQVQNAAKEQQQLANQLTRNGVYQVENSAKQLQVAQMVQTVAANLLSSKGLNDLNSIERFGLSADVRQCYLLNKFSFSDAINTAKSTTMQCINDKLNEGKTIMDNAINDLRAAAQNMSNAVEMIAQCREFTVTFPSAAGLVAKVTCLSQALINMKSNGILLPINLGRRVVEANAAISTIQSDIVKCNLNIVSAILTQSMNASQAIVDCISQSSSVNDLLSN